MNEDVILNKVKRGRIWSFCFWSTCISSLSFAISSLVENEFVVLSIILIAFWIWRIKFVYIDLKPIHIKIDIWATVSVIGFQLFMMCYKEYTRSLFNWGGVGEFFLLSDQFSSWIALLVYAPFFFTYDLKYLGIMTFLATVMNPIRLPYLIMEIKLLKSLKAPLSKKSV